MNWQRILYSLPAILVGLTVHEFSHAWVAYKLGDTTARDQGRITFNPLKHIDPLGLVFIIFAGFGWAKPVQFNPERLGHPRRDKALIAIAGPLSNLVLGIILILACRLMLGSGTSGTSSLYILAVYTLLYGAVINFGLFVFNLLPLPPLDGSHVFFSGLNLKPETERKIMRIGMPVLFIILIVESTARIDILPIGKIVDALVSLFLGK